ncbi:hypothetical protein [Nocardioides lijunqiniae]|uniref:hypothetical protein n=1 Tax=Nocardioides lijunqiniae TaxID=2760832 RepID=UPI0018784539|nr:hypothetical protein [Nocardioides lijunqiniae]
MTSSAADLLEVMRTTTRTAAAVEVERLGAVIDWCALHATTDEGEASFATTGSRSRGTEPRGSASSR